MNTVMIDGKEFDVAKLSPELQNLLNGKTRNSVIKD